MHVAQPIQLALQPERRHPLHLAGDLHHGVAQLVHGDEPLVHHPEHQLAVAAPAEGVAVAVLLGAVQQLLFSEVGEDAIAHVEHAAAGEPAEALHVAAVLVQRRDHRQAVLLAQREVLRSGAGGDVDDGGALRLTHLLPGDDPMRDFALRLQLVERPAVGAPHQRAAGHLLQHLDAGSVAGQHRQPLLAQVEHLAAGAHAQVAMLGVHRGGDVGGEGPRRGGPDQQRLTLGVGQRQAYVHRGMGHLLIPLGDDLVLRQAGAAARAPGHRVGAAVEPAVLVAALQEVPDGVVILIRHGVVGIIPVHPVAEAARLLGLDGGVLAHPLLAFLHEAGDAEGLDVVL